MKGLTKKKITVFNCYYIYLPTAFGLIDAGPTFQINTNPMHFSSTPIAFPSRLFVPAVAFRFWFLRVSSQSFFVSAKPD